MNKQKTNIINTESPPGNIYDVIFKKILTLSSKSVVRMINGLFNTDYPDDSSLTYNWTEFTKKDYHRILADTIITVNGTHSYHMEAQMEHDSEIIFRVFDYGVHHAMVNRKVYRNGEEKIRYMLDFPDPVIIFIGDGKAPEDFYEVEVNFGKQGSFIYQAEVFKYQEKSLEELNRRNLILLIPFQLIKLRSIVRHKKHTEKDKKRLIHLLQDDILGSIKKNLEMGNITGEDARMLCKHVETLFYHIYSDLEYFKEVADMVEESFIFDWEIPYIERDRYKWMLEDTKKELEDMKRKNEGTEKELEDRKLEISKLKILLKENGINPEQ